MFRSWGSGPKSKLSATSSSLTAQDEQDSLTQAMEAALHIMNDDLEGAEAGLRLGDSTFHKLGRALVAFLRAILGMEKEVIREAQDRLAEAEAQAWKDQKIVLKDRAAFRSSIYAAGTEYDLTIAQILLMRAVVGVLSESLTEALRGFYNLRKAYTTLNTIVQAEERHLQNKPNSRGSACPGYSVLSSQANSQVDSFTDVTDTTQIQRVPVRQKSPAVRADKPLSENSDDDDDVFEDVDETKDDAPVPIEYQGKTARAGDNIDQTHNQDLTAVQNTQSDEPSIFNQSPIDMYIHSGTSLCYGMLTMLLSMIPPAMGKLLNIIGFRGDREAGLRRLWMATKAQNINGVFAGLVILGFYNGIIQNCDIIPDASTNAADDAPQNIEGYPAHRLQGLICTLQARFPKSGLWRLERARMLAASQRIEESIPLLSRDLNSPLKQVNAIMVFERALQSMFSHHYEAASTSFISCLPLSDWSKALYFYLAGTCQVELYRAATKANDQQKAKAAAETAESYFGQVTENAGKRKFMAKQMPLETYCIQKLSKWNDRRQASNAQALVKVIEASPLADMTYLWNGNKKQSVNMLRQTLDILHWDRANQPSWATDERVMVSLLSSAANRCLHDHDKARNILKTEVLSHDKSEFTGGSKEEWMLPSAHYEMAVNLWQMRADIGTIAEGNSDNRALVREAQEWIEKAKAWGAYLLDARIGMRVTAAETTLRKWRAIHDQ